jgi:hypothetical protein
MGGQLLSAPALVSFEDHAIDRQGGPVKSALKAYAGMKSPRYKTSGG